MSTQATKASKGPAGEPTADTRRDAVSSPSDSPRPTLTKIIATLGPATSDEQAIARLVEAGASIFRLNFSHGSAAEHSTRLQTVRRVAESCGRPLAVFGDLQGPKIRIGVVAGDGVEVPAGAAVIFQRGHDAATNDGPPFRFTSTYDALVDDVQPGQRLLINDGAIRMLIVDKRDDEIECTVTIGGLITSGKGINLPESNISAGAITDRDWDNVRWAIENELDFLALSFVSDAAQINQLADGIAEIQAKFGRASERLPIIAKIERPAAVANIESIVDAADAIMVARGDLGVEMDLARVPVVQKRLLRIAQSYGKPCIVATQMLESMIDSPMPTRAEASDIAGAILDNADALMLSGETAVGKYPSLAAETMSRIARQTEAYLAEQPPRGAPPQKLVESRYRTAALAHGVWTVAQDIAAKFIVVWSQRGGGARYLSQNDFQIPIIAISSDERALQRMQLLRGVTPVRMPIPENLGEFTRKVDAYLQETRWAAPGDPCVLVAGAPIGKPGVTNSLAIHHLGDPRGGFAA